MKHNQKKTGKNLKIRMAALSSLLVCAGVICGVILYNVSDKQVNAEAKVSATEASETETESKKKEEAKTEEAETEKAVTEAVSEVQTEAMTETETETESETEGIDPAAQKQVDDLLAKIQAEKTGPAEEQGQKWAVSIYNLATGAKGNLSGDTAIQSASIIKAFIMATVFDRIVYPASEETKIVASCSEEELNNLMYNMITVSDNDASNSLIEILGNGDSFAGFDVVNKFCEEHGYKATHLGRRFLDPDPKGDNFTSTNDCMNLLAGIADGTLVNKEASEKMLSLLQQQQRRHKIPAGIMSSTAVIGNKTGELFGEFGDVVQNDIAIVEDGGIHYILCVMSSGLPGDGSSGMALITEISNITYTSFALIA